jgi:hypothetical protein
VASPSRTERHGRDRHSHADALRRGSIRYILVPRFITARCLHDMVWLDTMGQVPPRSRQPVFFIVILGLDPRISLSAHNPGPGSTFDDLRIGLGRDVEAGDC